ncbi:MAG: ribonuclease P protein component [Christensenellales bacterium]
MRREYSLRRNKEFKYVYRKGRSVSDSYMVLIYVPTKTSHLKVGFSVSRKLGNSVQRNKIKRRMKEAFFSALDNVSRNCLLIFTPREKAKHIDYQEIQRSVLKLLNKAGLIIK